MFQDPHSIATSMGFRIKSGMTIVYTMSKRQLAILGLIIANIILGAAPPIFKWSLQNVHLYTLLFLRNFIAAAVVGILCHNDLKIRKRDGIQLFFLAFFGVTLNLYFSFVGFIHTQSINAPIIASAAPIFLVLGSVLFFKERPTKKMLLGNLIGFFGIMIVVLQPLLGKATFDGSIAGNLYLVLGTFATIVYMLMAKEVAKKYQTRTILFWFFTFGAATFFFPFLDEVKTGGFLPGITYQGLIGIIFGAFFVSLTAYSLLTWAFKHILASEVGIFTYLDPIAALVIAMPLLHEYPSFPFLFGSFLIFFGIYIAENRLHYHPVHKLFQKTKRRR